MTDFGFFANFLATNNFAKIFKKSAKKPKSAKLLVGERFDAAGRAPPILCGSGASARQGARGRHRLQGLAGASANQEHHDDDDDDYGDDDDDDDDDDDV